MTDASEPRSSPPGAPQAAVDDATLRRVLTESRVIAVVGASPDWARPSCYTMQYLQSMGYRVYPVNPKEAGHAILGRPVYRRLEDIPEPVDLVNVFRRPDAVAPVVESAIAIGARAVWMQEGVRDEAAAAKARAAGLTVVMDRCPKKDHFRLFGGTEPRSP